MLNLHLKPEEQEEEEEQEVDVCLEQTEIVALFSRRLSPSPHLKSFGGFFEKIGKHFSLICLFFLWRLPTDDG